MVSSCSVRGQRAAIYITDPDVKIWRNEVSPNGNSRIVVFQHDAGALGYGRVHWAIAPANIDVIDLATFILPDGYRAEGWTKEGKLQISKWKPTYHLQDYQDLRNGDSYNGVEVELVENNSEHALPGFEDQ